MSSNVETLHETVCRHLDPLQARIRQELVADLARRLAARAGAAVAATSGTSVLEREADVLAALAIRARQVMAEVESEVAAVRGSFEDLRAAWPTSDEAARARAAERHLRKLGLDRRRWERGGLEALGEHTERAGSRLAILAELSLTLVGRAGAAALHQSPTGEMARALCLDAHLDTELLERVETAERWQNRLAALESLRRFSAALEAAGFLSVADPTTAAAAARAAAAVEEHPWVVLAAHELHLAVAPRRALVLVASRLDAPLGTRTDFLVRRGLVDLLRRVCRDTESGEAVALLVRALAHGDPSEHVRIGLGEAAAEIGGPAVRRYLGLGPDAAEPSARVRAATLRSLLRRLAAFSHPRRPSDLGATGVATLICRVVGEALATERDPLPLRVAAAASLALAADVDPDRPWLRAHLGTLVSLRARTDVGAEVGEAAAAAAEALARALDPARRRLTAALADIAREIRPGEGRLVTAADLGDGAPLALPSEDELGRALADLSLSDFGLQAEETARGIRLYRGEPRRRRLWRLLHELRHPSPVKRQGFAHTLGRRGRGHLRAGPGGMAEETATVVPGELVRVDRAGGWGRHLPRVDDFLDLPVGAPRPITVFSSHGAVTLSPPASFWRRLRNRFQISRDYRALAARRLASLASDDPGAERRFLAHMTDRYGIASDVSSWDYADVLPAAAARREEPQEEEGLGGPLAALAPSALSIFPAVRDWFDAHGYYFLSNVGNSQEALALFATGLGALTFTKAHLERRRFEEARARLPLCIGGWGTRGKSGTERLKAALFHGLGYHVFVKTTGCEAVVIDAEPGQPAHEILLHRPYEKATIWEQREAVKLAAQLGAEVFLWECMALRPGYVELLQRDWMHDDLSTITNAYPDHEDIQGPTGEDVARAITSFVPAGGKLLSTEVNFRPLFEEVCRERGTEHVAVSPDDADLIAEDMLALFPYREHPRNLALVARLAEELGLDRHLALFTMATHVVPDLGVLKAYPSARVRGRRLTFWNGMSANERTGFVSNWRRAGFAAIDPGSPDRFVVTVVNNRADRVARSEVFARILVEDVTADRHVLIGTNLPGLRGFILSALDEHLAAAEICGPDPAIAEKRLAQRLARLRIPAPSKRGLGALLLRHARGAGLSVAPERVVPLADRWAGLLGGGEDASVSLAEVRREISESSLAEAVAAALGPAGPDGSDETDSLPELDAPATAADVAEHFLEHLARLTIHARLRRRLAAAIAAGTPEAARGFDDVFRTAYREVFLAGLVVIPDAGASGDAVIDRCADIAPPGTEVLLLGTQNIKGTGLDFVYRWVVYETVVAALAKIGSARLDVALGGVRDIEGIEDRGLLDGALLRRTLPALIGATPNETLRRRLEFLAKRIVAEGAGARRAEAQGRRGSALRLLASAVEELVDPWDAIRRRSRSRRTMTDLAQHHVSHARAAREMKEIHQRERGGWLLRR